MFDRIAGIYDRLNSVMTAGLHHQWRRRAAELAAVGPGDRVLDVATGTGDLALEAASRVGPAGEVVGSDFSERMLELARAKAARRRDGVRFECGNALVLPFADGEFDAATVGFGARNFSDLEQGLREMARVVRPGGHVVVLEITTPTRPPLSTFFDVWFDRIVPVLGRVAGDADAYTYLPNSVKRFPGPEELAALMWDRGLRRVRYVLTAGGIIALHVGEVPVMSAVQAVFDVGGDAVPRLMERIEERMASLAGGHGALLGRYAGDTIAAGGKRLRPLLVCLAAGAAARDRRARPCRRRRRAGARRDACPRRRARRLRAPAGTRDGRRFGRARTCDRDRRPAVLAGLCGAGRRRRLGRGGPGAVRGRVSELALGELMQRADAWNAEVTVERYLERCRLKTAALFSAACALGAIEGGGDEAALATFGDRIGLAFQILDDVLDVSGPPERTGKPQGADLLDGTVTLPLIVARSRDATLAGARPARGPDRGRRRGWVCERITATGALGVARDRALELVAAAKKLLPAVPDRQRTALELVADGVVERYA